MARVMSATGATSSERKTIGMPAMQIAPVGKKCESRYENAASCTRNAGIT